MGSGNWDTDVYSKRVTHKATTGQATFSHMDDVYSGRTAFAIHPSLDPRGVTLRESRDSDEHPLATDITVAFDVTGTMGSIPHALQRKLPELFGLLLRKDYVSDPQIMFSAIGDANCDHFPLQIGQWESDNRLDENLENIILEGGGGGQKHETYELFMYFMARHTATDRWDKRGQKGYLFIIGDELAYSMIKRHQVASVIGDTLEADIPVEAIAAELRERFNVFFILPKGAAFGGDPQVLAFWRKLFGEGVLELDDPEAVCETIALTIGQMEDAIDLEEGVEHLRELGVDDQTVTSVSRALAKLNPDGKPATTNGSLPGLVATTDSTPSATRRI